MIGYILLLSLEMKFTNSQIINISTNRKKGYKSMVNPGSPRAVYGFLVLLEESNLIIAINNYFTFFITSDKLSQATVKSSFISFKLSPKTVTSPALTLCVN